MHDFNQDIANIGKILNRLISIGNITDNLNTR